MESKKSESQNICPSDKSKDISASASIQNAVQGSAPSLEPPAEPVSFSYNMTCEPESTLPAISFADLPLPLQKACANAHWTTLMPVQALALPYLLEKRELMVQSRTGSGKTGTYLLPLLKHLDAEKAEVQSLVLVPTRELAVQVEREAHTLFEGTGLRAVAVYGGVGYGKQHEALRSGAQLVVGTPGRILDHLLRRSLSLEKLRMLIFDEADRMLSIGFYPDMKQVQSYLPNKPIATCLFSATYPPHVLRLAGEFMESAAMLSLSQVHVHVPEVQHSYCLCKAMDKDRALIRLLEMENPTSAIIFCNTKANVHYINEVLKGFGYDADELSADLSQSRREKVLQKIRLGTLRLLVATDVAARGIDIPELSHVFLYEPPEDHESYIHRAGRTGRAGAAGTVISLVDVMQKLELERIAKRFSVPLVPRETPTDAEVSLAVGQRVLTLLETRQRKRTGLERERQRRFGPMVRVLSQGGDLASFAKDSAAACDEENFGLLAMLLDDCYQESLKQAMLMPQENAQARDGKHNHEKRSGTSRKNTQRKRRRNPQSKNTGEGGQHG